MSTVTAIDDVRKPLIEGDNRYRVREEHLGHARQAFEHAAAKAKLPQPRRCHTLVTVDRAGREASLKAAQRWVNGDLAGLLFIGPVGVGKTTTAAAAACELALRDVFDRDTLRSLRQGPAFHWVTAPNLLLNLAAPFDSRERDEAQKLILGSRPLIVDDIDKVRPTEFAGEQIFALVDHCEQTGRRLIVTTNLKPSQLAAKWPNSFGEAIASRLVGYCEQHVITGSDRRLDRSAA